MENMCLIIPISSLKFLKLTSISDSFLTTLIAKTTSNTLDNTVAHAAPASPMLSPGIPKTLSKIKNGSNTTFVMDDIVEIIVMDFVLP